MPQHKPAYRLQVFQPRSIDPSEVTILTPIGGAAHSDQFKVTTLPSMAGWKPYLQQPSGRSGRLDTLTKRTDIGVMTFRILDPQIGATKTTRWLAAFTGDAKGRLRLGNLKAFAEESLDGGATWTPFWTGRIRQVRDDVVAVDLVIRELADDLQALAFVGRPHASITYAGFPTVLPIARTSVAYGSTPTVVPLTGTVGPAVLGRGGITLDAASKGRADNIVTSNLIVGAPQLFVWREVVQASGQARVRVKRLDTQAVGYFRITGALLVYAIGEGHRAVEQLFLQELPSNAVGYLAIPPDTTSVEFWVEIEHYATEDSPLLIGDVHPVTLWKDILDGKFGYLWTPDETLPGGKSYGDVRLPIPYDTAAFATLEADDTIPKVRFVVKKREKRGEWITKHLLPAAHLGYYIDGSGKVVPVDLRTPSAATISAAPTITDTDLLGLPEWDYDRARAVTRVDAAYYQDLPVAQEDITKDTAQFPTIPKGGFKEARHPISILEIGNLDLGDVPLDLDVAGFRFMEGDATVQGQPRSKYIEGQLNKLALATARPFGFAAPELILPCVRGSAGDVRPGAVRKVDVDAVLDPLTNVRGGTRVIQSVGREERGPVVQITAVDLGGTSAAAVPTLGVPAAHANFPKNAVTVNVTLNGTSDPVEINYAVTSTGVGTAPVEASPLWSPLTMNGFTFLIKGNGNVHIFAVPAGSRIWVRGRSLPGVTGDYRQPSAWEAAASPGRADTTALTAPSSPASANIKARSFRVTWTNGEANLGTEILLATPTGDPRVVVARLPAGSTLYDFPGGTGVDILPSTTYRVGIRHYQDSPASVSAEVTVDVTTTTEAPTLKPPTFRPYKGILVN